MSLIQLERVVMHAETQYCIDSMVELGELTVFEGEIASYSAGAHERIEAYREQYPTEFKAARVAQIVRGWVEQQTPEHQTQLYQANRYIINTRNILRQRAIQERWDPRPSIVALEPIDATVERFVRELELAGPNIELAQHDAMARSIFRQPTVGRYARSRIPRAEQKAVLKRAWRMSERFGFSGDVQVLLGKGYREVWDGNSPWRWRFRITHGSVQSLATHDHGALTISLVDHRGRHLAALCIFVRQTPVIDQYVAFANLIRHGQERAILERANFFSVSDLGYDTLQGHGLKLPVRPSTRELDIAAAFRSTTPSQMRSAMIPARLKRQWGREFDNQINSDLYLREALIKWYSDVKPEPRNRSKAPTCSLAVARYYRQQRDKITLSHAIDCNIVTANCRDYTEAQLCDTDNSDDSVYIEQMATIMRALHYTERN